MSFGFSPFNYGPYGSTSATPQAANPITHSNTWLSPVGQAVGAALGNTIFAPIGGTFWGAPAGKMAGQTLGDIFGGNWAGVGADNQQANAPLQALGLPNMGGNGFFGMPSPQMSQNGGLMGGLGNQAMGMYGGMPGMGMWQGMPGMGLLGGGGGQQGAGGSPISPFLNLLGGMR